jgi:hypothetical protein
MASTAPVPSTLDPAVVLKATQTVLGSYVGEKTARDWTSEMLRKLHIGLMEEMSREHFEAVLGGLAPGLEVIVGPAKASSLIEEIRSRFTPRSA